MVLEFASRRSVHIHWFAYIKDAPQYDEVDNETVARFYNYITACSSDIKPEQKKYLEYQLRRHSKCDTQGNLVDLRPVPLSI